MADFTITEPVTLAEAKSHLRVYYDTDDSYISSLITAAREYAEAFQNRLLVARSESAVAGTDYYTPGSLEKQAMLLIVGDLYASRENAADKQRYVIPTSAEKLLWFNRVVPV